MFCPNCKSILLPKPGKKVLICKCGYKKEGELSLKEQTNNRAQKIEIIDSDTNIHPLVDEECPQCKHPRSYFYEKQTRSADEPATKFFRCEKCGHTRRDYK